MVDVVVHDYHFAYIIPSVSVHIQGIRIHDLLNPVPDPEPDFDNLKM
jgi:hypothetical protein